ncbi:phosphatidylethanolamine-binding protein 1 [Platysternon megacephalum]|uniref:Phosphatidylethanolamine-binding protein 1 n=1 Tax=Platysternon megacephalum TaxID=55544 RepID=A0A4D9E7I0_9SAUR|nr:phosphatidylethanolamine-binding protein 1 [Platysternon megacephalum]
MVLTGLHHIRMNNKYCHKYVIMKTGVQTIVISFWYFMKCCKNRFRNITNEMYRSLLQVITDICVPIQSAPPCAVMMLPHYSWGWGLVSRVELCKRCSLLFNKWCPKEAEHLGKL